ncbi:MAG TPA: type II toxin-antitoxin system HicB family antitoxin [Chitinophagaceae bacterium]|nr:type II toxin-antitoxin system HicB family antitoxin [Chitinophagaceae bacterium]
MEHLFTAHIEKDANSGYYIGTIPNVPGAHTQAKTLDELSVRLKEVLELCFESMSEEEKKEIPQFVGTQQISVAV